MRSAFWTCLILFWALPAYGEHSFAISREKFLAGEDAQNIYCLASSYPQVKRFTRDRKFIQLADGRLVSYAAGPKTGLAVDVRAAMALPYPLEPDRPDSPTSPGRCRSYDLLKALYGGNGQEVARQTQLVPFMGKNLRVARAAAAPLKEALVRLATLAKTPEQKAWLKPDGAFYWRKIAGENVLSAHSFGIAVDLGAKKAPYWRWSRQMPHPMQKTYPSEIVSALESQGFIWGGKWHEYDLMHFEYRPELICKAKIQKALQP